MNTFLRLSLFTFVCTGLALMLAGNAAAQQQGNIRFVAETEQELVLKPIEVGDPIPLTITLVRNNQRVPRTQVTFSEAIQGTATIDPPSDWTQNGVARTVVTFLQSGNIDIIVSAPGLNSTYVHRFQVEAEEKEFTRIVATPVTAAGKPVGNLAVGDTFTYKIEAKNVRNLLGAWQMDVAFDPNVVRVAAIRKGDFLESGDRESLFVSDTVGNIISLSQTRIGVTLDDDGNRVHIPNPSPLFTPNPQGGVRGSGELLQIDFKVLEFAETTIGLHNVQLSESKIDRPGWFNDTGDPIRISHYVVTNPVVVTHRFPKQDVNRDKMVDIRDLVIVAGNLGKARNPRADLNDDGMVTVLDLVLITQHDTWGKKVAPSKVRNVNGQVGTAPLARTGQPADVNSQTIQGWIASAQVEDDGSAIFDLGIANLEALLASRIPSETKLLLNYPNPFNPETWVPYQLAEATEVTVTIHSVNGSLIRSLALGHQAAGIYQSKSQAAYWDGRNELGEHVASGVYFYTLTAGNFSATGKMLVRK